MSKTDLLKFIFWGLGIMVSVKSVVQNKKILLVGYNFECEAEGLINVGKELTSVLKVLFI